MWVSLLLLAALLLVILSKVYKGLFSGSSPNPFLEDVKRPPAPLVTDKEARKKVLKQGERGRHPGDLGCARASSRVSVSQMQSAGRASLYV